eukprot:m.18574 g.18574  ORF g.18574 m.18574 type:complete len:291 (+) comp27681_c0_seq1:98-970(+)
MNNGTQSSVSDRPRRKRLGRLRFGDEEYEWYACNGKTNERLEARKRKQAKPMRLYMYSEEDCDGNDGVEMKEKLTADQGVGEDAGGVLWALDKPSSQQNVLVKSETCDSPTESISAHCHAILQGPHGFHCHCDLAESLQYFQLLVGTQLKSFEEHMNARLTKHEEIFKIETARLKQLFVNVSAMQLTVAKQKLSQKSQRFDTGTTNIPVIVPGSVTSRPREVDRPAHRPTRPPPPPYPSPTTCNRKFSCHASPAGKVEGQSAGQSMTGVGGGAKQRRSKLSFCLCGNGGP